MIYQRGNLSTEAIYNGVYDCIVDAQDNCERAKGVALKPDMIGLSVGGDLVLTVWLDNGIAYWDRFDPATEAGTHPKAMRTGQDVATFYDVVASLIA